MTEDYSKYSEILLNKTIDLYNGKLLELKLEDTPNQDKIQKVQSELAVLIQTLNEKTKPDVGGPSESTSGQSSAVPGYSLLLKEMQNAFRDVSSFESGCDVHSFINRLEMYYGLYVIGNECDQIEQMFVRLATAKMSTDYAQAMQHYKPIVDTFEKMKDYLKHHHASKMSAYQYLDTCWELEELESENLRDFARRISDKMSEARNVIEAKYEAYLRSIGSKIDDKTMSTKEVFDMVSGQIFLQRLKMKRPKIFNQIVSDLDEVWNATDIANRAMAYQERMANEDEPSVTKPGTSLTIDKKAKNGQKKKGICYKFIEGKCTYGEKCYKKHDTNLKNLFDKKSPKTMEKSSTMENSKASSGGGGKGHTFTAANLPTQDFHQ